MFASRMPSFCEVWFETFRSSSTPTTVSHTLPTLIGLPIGSSVVKNRVFTPCPMIATGAPSATCMAANRLPSTTVRFRMSKYVVSTPTTFPERRRPSRVTSVCSTISPLAVLTLGTTERIAAASCDV